MRELRIKDTVSRNGRPDYLALNPGIYYRKIYLAVHVLVLSTGFIGSTTIYPDYQKWREATEEELLLACSRCKEESIRKCIKKWLKERL